MGTALARAGAADPGELGMTFREGDLPVAAGGVLRYWQIKGARAPGPRVIFTHGWSDSRYVALAQWAELLLPHVSELVLYDMRGHGDHSGHFSGGRLEQAELIELLDALDRAAVEDGQAVLRSGWVLAGHSLGAAISLVTAEQESDRVAGVWAESTMIRPLLAVRHQLRQRRWPAEPISSMGLSLAGILGQVAMPDLREIQPRFAGSVVFCHGRGDQRCPWAEVDQVADRWLDADRQVFDSQRHRGVAEDDATGYVDALKRFFSRVEGCDESAGTGGSN